MVELLIVASIVAVISIIAVGYGNSYKESEYNAKRKADIETLGNSLGAYYQVHNAYPEPKANVIYYDASGIYTHSFTGSFGESSYVSSDLMPKEFLNYLPLDPATNHYYAYGKRNDGTLGYDLASVMSQGNDYVTYLRGTYDATSLVSLIREYDGPSFVFEGSSDHLPYNPYELKATAEVKSYSGSIASFVLLRNDVPVSFTGTIYEGDRLKVATGSLAVVHVSDGTEMNVGNPNRSTVLDFQTLEYANDDNIVTKVSLYLQGGEVWIKAPKLRTDSDFDVETDGALATVR